MHVTLALNVAMALRRETDNALFYSYVFVTCAEADRAHSHCEARCRPACA